MSMKQALNRLALYCAAQSIHVRVGRDGFSICPRGMLPHHAHTISVDELADRVEAMNSAPVSSPTTEAESALRTLRAMGYAWRGGERWAPPIGDMPAFVTRELDGAAVLHAEGYEQLADVLLAAFNQAARGKGKERHAKDQPFHEQVMQVGAQHFGTGALLFQAFKKSEESQRLPHGRAEAELLGAIVYLAGAVIAERRKPSNRMPAANDPHATVAAHG